MQMTLNLDVWNSLPDDLRKIVQKNAIRFRDYMIVEHHKLDKKAVAEAKAKFPKQAMTKIRIPCGQLVIL
jgi:TRAP-type C4-dicarboxylate transport system substrate-binding protein